jgi:hypothetical protein
LRPLHFQRMAVRAGARNTNPAFYFPAGKIVNIQRRCINGGNTRVRSHGKHEATGAVPHQGERLISQTTPEEGLSRQARMIASGLEQSMKNFGVESPPFVKEGLAKRSQVPEQPADPQSKEMMPYAISGNGASGIRQNYVGGSASAIRHPNTRPIIPPCRFGLLAQTADATPSCSLIRNAFREGPISGAAFNSTALIGS